MRPISRIPSRDCDGGKGGGKSNTILSVTSEKGFEWWAFAAVMEARAGGEDGQAAN